MNWKESVRKSYLRPFDVLIILLLIAASFLPFFLFGFSQQVAEGATIEAVLKVDGKVIKTFTLTDNTKTYTYTWKDEDGHTNLIEVKGQRIHIKESNCKDQICVKAGWISKPGQDLVCLPHNLILYVQSSDGSEDGSVIY